MKEYIKPVVTEIEISSEDIIQTSPVENEGLIPGVGFNDGAINWSLRSSSDAIGNVFQK